MHAEKFEKFPSERWSLKATEIESFFFFLIMKCCSYNFFSIHFWLYQAFLAVCRLSLTVASKGQSIVVVCGLSLQWLLSLQSVGFSTCGTQAQLSHDMWTLQTRYQTHVPLHWQAYSQPLDHEGHPLETFFTQGINSMFKSGEKLFPERKIQKAE